MFKKEVEDKSYGRLGIPRSGLETYLEGESSNYSRVEHETYCNDLRLYTTTWTTTKDNIPKVGDLLFIHGYSEHSARFLKHITLYLDSGFSVHLIDLPGHGRSDGIHGKLVNFSVMLDCLLRFVLQLDSKYEFTNFYMMGSSLGSLLVLNLVIRLQKLEAAELINLKGIILLAPPLFPANLNSLSKVQRFTLKFINRFWPDLLISHSDDTNFEKEFMKDKLNYTGGVRVSTLIFLMKGIHKVRKYIKDVNVPLLLVQGLLDTNVDPEGAKFVYASCTSVDKSIKFIKFGRHDLLNSGSNTRQISKLCLSWVVDRSS